MTEDMPGRMPEDMPVTKCINVMVGITRSKVISLWRRDPVLELQLPMPLRAVLLCLAAQPLQIAL